LSRRQSRARDGISSRAWHAPGHSFPGDLMSKPWRSKQSARSWLPGLCVLISGIWLFDCGLRMSTCMAFLEDRGCKLASFADCEPKDAKILRCCSRKGYHFDMLKPSTIGQTISNMKYPRGTSRRMAVTRPCQDPVRNDPHSSCWPLSARKQAPNTGQNTSTPGCPHHRQHNRQRHHGQPRQHVKHR